MHPSSIKLIINALSLSDAILVRSILQGHSNRLQSVINNCNWGLYERQVWINDMEITTYTLSHLEKTITARSKEVPA